MKVVFTPSDDGQQLTIAAIDLTGDAWGDYLHYIEQARRFESSNDLHGTNRALRAALTNLIAHLEGVVGGLHKKLAANRSDFHPSKRSDGMRCTLKDQIADLRRHAQRAMGKPLPYLRLRMKALRDILVHPSISKIDPDSSTASRRYLSEVNLFDFSVKLLTADGSHISSWLDALCTIYGYTRVHDTYKIVAETAKKLGTGPEPTRI
jgi:hypothetical protein